MKTRDMGPVPSREEDLLLIGRAQAGGPAAIAARNELVERHSRFTSIMARRFAEANGRPDLRDDFEQEAAIGLCDAILDFEASWGVRLISYARHRMRHRMRECLWAQDLIRVPPQWRSEEAMRRAEARGFGRPRARQVHERCKAAAAAALAPMSRLGPVSSPRGGTVAVADDLQPDPSELAQLDEELRRLLAGLDRLNPALREVVLRRAGISGRPETYAELAARFGTTPPRIKVLEQWGREELARLLSCAGLAGATAKHPAA